MRILIEKLFRSFEVETTEVDRDRLLQIATATLLLEVINADFEVQQSEMDKLQVLLSSQFRLGAEELNQLLTEAKLEADHMVSLQHITRQLNEQFNEQEKTRVIEMMWEMVFADGNLDRYEEHLIRQVAELLYLPHSAFIKARHKSEPPVM